MYYEMSRGVLIKAHLLQLFNDHGECFEDGSGWTSQGDDPLWTAALGDVDASPTLDREKETATPVLRLKFQN